MPSWHLRPFLSIPDSVCDSGWGSSQAPPTLLTYLYLIFSFSDAGEALWSLRSPTVISIIGSSIVTLGRALIMEPSALDLYGFGSVRSLVPF